MKVSVNGSQREISAESTVADLLRELGLTGATGVAVAVDRRVVPRADHASTALYDGAAIDVIRAVGGG